MTNLGATQCFDSGTYYRNRYVVDGAPDRIAGISAVDADLNQLWVSAPDQPVRLTLIGLNQDTDGRRFFSKQP